MIIGKRLKQARKNKGYTQEKLATLIGVSTATISNYEKEKRNPILKMLIKISDLLEVKVDYLLGRDVMVVCDSDEEYKVVLSKEDLQILKELKKDKKLYQEFANNPERSVKRIKKEINWI